VVGRPHVLLVQMHETSRAVDTVSCARHCCAGAANACYCVLQALVMPRQSHGLKDKIMEYILGL